MLCAVPGVEQCDLLCRGSRLYLFHIAWMQHAKGNRPPWTDNYLKYIVRFYLKYDPTLVRCLAEDGTEGDISTCGRGNIELML